MAHVITRLLIYYPYQENKKKSSRRNHIIQGEGEEQPQQQTTTGSKGEAEREREGENEKNGSKLSIASHLLICIERCPPTQKEEVEREKKKMRRKALLVSITTS